MNDELHHKVEMDNIREWGQQIMSYVKEETTRIMEHMNKIEDNLEKHIDHVDRRYMTKAEGEVLNQTVNRLELSLDKFAMRMEKQMAEMADKINENTLRLAKIFGGIAIIAVVASYFLGKI